MVSVDSNIHAYDAHYLLGNYYQSLAATAGSINEGEKAPNSICPKGWKLPDGYGGDNLYSLLHSYGYPSSEGYENGQTAIRNNGKLAEDNPFAPPMYFTMSGDVCPIDHGVYSVGSFTYLWTNSIEVTTGNREPDNYYTLVTPSMSAGENFVSLHGTDIYMPGNSIRCVAR